MKKNLLLLLVSLTSLTSCGFLTNDKQPIENNTDKPSENQTNNENTNTGGSGSGIDYVDPDEVDIEEKEADEKYLGEKNKEDTTKNKFTINWKSEGKTLSTQNNVIKGSYPKIDGANKTPTKTSTETDYLYTFKGWSIKDNSTTGLEEDELFPVLADTTYNAVFEKKKAYTAEFYYVEGFWKGDKSKFKLFNTVTLAEGEVADINNLLPPYNRDHYSLQLNIIEELDDDLNNVIDTEDPDKGTIWYEKEDYLKNGGIKKNTKYLLRFSEQANQYKITFKNENVLYHETTLEYETTLKEKYYDQYVKDHKPISEINIYGKPEPLKIVDGKKYKFLGWRNENASSGALSLDEIPAISSDTTYNAVFSDTECSDVFVSLVQNDGKPDVLTLAQAKDNNYYKVENGVLKPGSAYYDTFVNKYYQFDFSLVDSSITGVDKESFRGLNIKSIQFGNQITSLPEKVMSLSHTEDLTTVKIGSSLTSIPNYAFSSCRSLSKFEGFEYIKSFGEGAFRQCSSLNVNAFNTSSLTVGKESFYGARLPSEVSLTITSIPSSAFLGAKNLSKLTLKNTQTIGDKAFAFSSVEELKLPASLKTLEITASVNLGEVSGKPFEDCSSLNKVEIDSSNTTFTTGEYNGIFNKSLETLIQGTNNVIIPNTTKTIEEGSLSSLTFQKIYFPKSVTSIQEGSFKRNDNLAFIDYQGTKEEFKKICEKSVDYTFHGYIENDITIRCSDGEISLNLKNKD